MLSRKKYLFFILNFIIGTIFFTILFHYLLSLSLQKSLLFAALLSFVFDIGYIFEEKRKNKIQKKTEHKPKERVVYSWKNFFIELISYLFVFTTAYFSGVGIEKSIAMALYVFILFTVYYSTLSYKYVIPYRRIRLIIVFVGITSGLYLFLIDNLILSGLIGAFFTVMVEKDYKITKKLLSEGLVEEKHLKRGASRLFSGISYGYSALITLMIVNKIYTTTFVSESLSVMYRLLYLFTVVFIPLGTLIGWARIKLHEIKYKSYKRG